MITEFLQAHQTIISNPLAKVYYDEVVTQAPDFTNIIIQGLEEGYESSWLNTFNLALNPLFEPYQIGTTRHHLINRNIENLLSEAQFPVSIEATNPAGYFFVVANFGRWYITFSRGDEHRRPRESEFRKNARILNHLFDCEGKIPEGTLKCELVHGPQENDSAKLGFAHLCLIDSDGNEVRFDLLKLPFYGHKGSVTSPPIPPKSTKSVEPPEPVVQMLIPNTNDKKKS